MGNKRLMCVVCGGAAAFKMRSLKNLFFKLLILKVQANEIRLLVKCKALHPPPLPSHKTAIRFTYASYFLYNLSILLLNKNYSSLTNAIPTAPGPACVPIAEHIPDFITFSSSISKFLFITSYKLSIADGAFAFPNAIG